MMQTSNNNNTNKMGIKLFFWALTSSLAGFLFGFDTVVISGAERTIQALWQLNDVQHGLAMSMALWGTVLGALCGAWPTDKFGRQKTLLFIGAFYLVSAIWSALATDVYSFMLARFIGGVGVGVSTVAAPLYIAEIAPAKFRGRLTGLFQFNIVFGILIAFVSNALLVNLGDIAWRWMLGVEAIPALIFTLLCIKLPESPRWLITRAKNHIKAHNVLALINPQASEHAINNEIQMIEASAHQQPAQKSKAKFWSSRLKVPILLAFLVAFFNQLSGINAILYFAPRIFELTGLGNQAALLQSIGIGITNLIFTFLGLYLIDRLGRKTLLLIGSLGYISALGVCTLLFSQHSSEFDVMSAANKVTEIHQQIEQGQVTPNDASWQSAVAKLELKLGQVQDQPSQLSHLSSAEIVAKALEAKAQAEKAAGNSGFIIVLSIFAFIASHAIGQGAVIWVFISEVFPNQFRAAGQALGCFTHWFFAATITLVFPLLVSTFAASYVFALFLSMMILQLIWVIFFVPETKGLSLEVLEQKLINDRGNNE